jgi:hypothetical protein
MTTVSVIAVPGVTPAGAFQGPNTGTVFASTTDNTFSIDVRDLDRALKSGYVPVYKDCRVYSPPVAAVATASVGLIVNSVALTNTTLTIAAQPDVPRQAFVRFDPGTTPITAGVCTVVYGANDGTAAQTDVISLVAALSTPGSTNLSKGVLTVTSATVTGLTGGTSPKIQIGTTANLAVPLPPGAVDVTILKETNAAADVAVGTLTNAGIWTPHAAPNASLIFGIAYSVIAP